MPHVSYRTHVQNVGWQGYVSDGATSGTSGRSLRLEGINIKASGVEGLGISYSTHVQNVGWQGFVSDGALSGTTGRSLRLEAIKIKLTGSAAGQYDVYYRVHCQNIGWMNWAKNGAPAGSEGKSLRLEAIQIKIVEKGAPAPSGSGLAFTRSTGDGSINYRSHVQNVGWQGYTSDSRTSGTSGRSLRLEALNINVSNVEGLDVAYRAHVQNIGWQGWKKNGEQAGTTGRSLRVEALEVKLEGARASDFDVYYRVHAQNVGWMGWAKNGEPAGTTSCSLRLEALQIVLKKKGEAAPGPTEGHYYTVSYSYNAKPAGLNWTAAVTDGAVAGTTGKSTPIEQLSATLGEFSFPGDVQYRVHSSNIGWQGFVSGGKVAGTSGKKIEAISMRLTGSMAANFDIYYRVHVSNIGWMGWAKNGGNAGTTTLSLGVEAYQVKVVPKGSAAPGPTSGAYRDYPIVSGNATLDGIIDSVLDRTGRGYGALRNAFNYVAGYPYFSGSKYPTGNWSVPFAIEMYNHGGGNCYRYAALFCWLARGLGYDANVVSGYVPSLSGGRAPHGWVEIRSGGTTYVCDPDMQSAIPDRNWFWVTYDQAPTWYYK